MASSDAEQRELQLIEKVDLKILNVANNEKKLQQLLDVYLPPLLLKVCSEHASVRAKVVTIVQRLRTFVQPTGIVLPVSALVDQFKAADSPVLKQLDIAFIQHSLGRLDSNDKKSLIPKVLRGLGQRPEDASAPQMFNVFLRLLTDLSPPPRGSDEEGAFREAIGLSDPKDASFVAAWLGRLLLLRRPGSAVESSPGLIDSQVRFLTLDRSSTWDPAERNGLVLPATRAKAVSFLASGAFTDEERFLPAIYAAAAPDGAISGLGSEMLKRSQISLENAELVQTLFRQHALLPPVYRTRILGLLSKSLVATTFAEEIRAVVRRDMGGDPNEGHVESSGGATTGRVDSAGNTAGPRPKTGRLETTKMRNSLFEFITWISRMGPDRAADFNKIGIPLITELRQFIERQGWPVSDSTSPDEVELREKAYETIGMLAKGTKMADAEKFDLIGWLFRSLTEDPLPDVVVSLEAALSSLTGLFQPPYTGNTGLQLRMMLLSYMTLSENEGDRVVRSAKLAATTWANRCLPFHDVHARWIDILAVSSTQTEVVQEGRFGLNPWARGDDVDENMKLPDWAEMVSIFFKEPMTGYNMPGLMLNTSAMDVDMPSTVFINFQGDAVKGYPSAVAFCRDMLILSVLPEYQHKSRATELMMSGIRRNKKLRDAVRSALHSVDSQALFDLLDAAFQGVSSAGPGAEMCGNTFIEIASLSPASVTGRLAHRNFELLGWIKSPQKAIRNHGAVAAGILGSHGIHSEADVHKFALAVSSLASLAEDGSWKPTNDVERAAFLAYAHLISRRVFYVGLTPDLLQQTFDKSHHMFHVETISQASNSTKEVVIEAVIELCTTGLLLSGNQHASKPGATTEDPASHLISWIAPLAKEGNEKAITALGRLVIGLDVQPVAASESEAARFSEAAQSILDTLHELHTLKDVQAQLTVGEAITAAIAAWDSDVVQLTVDVEVRDTFAPVRHKPARLVAELKRVLDGCKSTKPSLLKASSIWLLCIVQNCSHLPEVQSKLRECQAAFTRSLSARDPLVQETGSRGLSLVYESGDTSLKAELVRDLVATFTGSGPKLQVEEDTELFDAGALPTEEGSSVTSYKDIVSLANEVGDQSLIYKFMSLAHSAAAWNTRSAFGQFGLGSILSDSKVDVDPKLYPKLYRYCFDPSPTVQNSMKGIWKSLVKDSNAVLDTHFDAIMKDLLKNVLGREWRVREASCAAIAELIQGRPYPKYEPYYKDIWTAALRVLDDIKATVREAALKLCMTLSNTLVRLLEESGTSPRTAAMIKEALPFLLSEKGIESSAEDVKLFATVTVLKITKAGGPALKPYIASMVPQLLGVLSTVEPEALNYHYQRAGDERKEKIDKLRNAMVTHSPIVEAIERALVSVDSDIMADLAAGLETTGKTALGIPTKLGYARVLSTLATRHRLDFAPYASRFLLQLEKLILDRNEQTSRTYASTAAYVIRAAPAESQLHYANKLTALYLGAEDENRREKVADAVLSLSKVSPDHFSSLEVNLLPLAYLAKHDDDEYVTDAFKDVWGKHAGASSRAVARYAPEITALSERALDTAQWVLRHAGALAIAGLVESLSGPDGGRGVTNTPALLTAWPVYKRALALKTFPGKEKLLEPFPDFVTCMQTQWKGNAEMDRALREIVSREAKRNNVSYRPHAFRCLWRFARARGDLDMFETIVTIVTPVLEEFTEKFNEMDVDDDGTKDKEKKGKDAPKKEKELLQKAAKSAVEAVARGYSTSQMAVDPAGTVLLLMQSIGQFLGNPAFYEIRRSVMWSKCIQDLMNDPLNRVDHGEKGGKRENGVGVQMATLCVRSLGLIQVDASSDAEALRRYYGTREERVERGRAVVSIFRTAATMLADTAGLPLLNKALDEAVALLSGDMTAEAKTELWKEVYGSWYDSLPKKCERPGCYCENLALELPLKGPSSHEGR